MKKGPFKLNRYLLLPFERTLQLFLILIILQALHICGRGSINGRWFILIIIMITFQE